MGMDINTFKLGYLIIVCLGILSLAEGQDGIIQERQDDDDYDIQYDYNDRENHRNLVPQDEFFTKHWPPKTTNGTEIKDEKAWQEEYDKLKIIWDKLNEKKPTRAVPVCFPYGHYNVPFLKEFEDTNATLSDENTNSLPVAAMNGAYDIIEKIEYFQIKSPDTADGGIGTLNQWMHIVVTAKQPLEGLFLQAISGPLGIPFGIFSTDFECHNSLYNAVKVKHDDAIINNCYSKSKLSIRHPTFFISKVKGTVFRVHFNWEEVRCSYVPRLQFLVIAIKNFESNSFTRFFTPSYERIMDSVDGIPYPYYSEWENKMECQTEIKVENTLGTIQKNKLYYHTVRSNFSILFNYEYDVCLRQMIRNCPPGHLKCTSGPNFINEITVTKTELDADNHKDIDNISFKMDCPVPKACAILEQTEPVLILEQAIQNKSLSSDPITGHLLGKDGGSKSKFLKNLIQNKRLSRATHGHIMILAWMMCMGIGTFWSRFFKEIGGLNSNGTNGCLGMGHWLWGHIIMFVIGLALIWVGIMEVTRFKDTGSIPCEYYNNLSDLSSYFNLSKTNKLDSTSSALLNDKQKSQNLFDLCNKRKTMVLIHTIIGCFAVFLFHVSFITGWFRPLKTVTRTIIVYIHIFTGYAGKIFAVMSVFVMAGTKTFCKDILIMVILLWAVTIILLVIASALQCKKDKVNKIYGRKFITNEGIAVPTERDPYSLTKLILLIVSWVLHLLFYIATYFVYIYIFDITKIKNNESLVLKKEFDDMPYFVIEWQLPSWKIDAYIYTRIIEMKSPSASNGTI